MRRAAILLVLAAGGCGVGDSESDRAEKEQLQIVRRALLQFKGEPGGATARVLDARLVNGRTICGHVDGNDGDGPRNFSITGLDVAVEQPGDAATLAEVAKHCIGPSRQVRSRNAEFTDLSMVD